MPNLPALLDARGRTIETRQPLSERRDPRGATNLIGYASPTMPIVQEWDADQAFRLGYLANVIAYRCVQILAGNASTPPLVAGKNPRKPTAINEESPLVRFLGPPPGGPAPKLSARKLLRWTFAQQLITGRRAWEIELSDDGRMPVAFWPLVAGQINPVPSTGGNEWFRVFKYGRPDRPVFFAPEEVFYGWDPSGLDFRQAESPLQAARYDLSLVTMCDRYGLAFLRNNAVPAAIITTAAFPDDTLRRAFRNQWAGEFGGVTNAGRPRFNEVEPGDDGSVAGAIDVKVLGISAKDAQLIQQRKDAMMEIAISLGVPWSKLDASGRTFDNAGVEDRTMWEERILPLMDDLRDDINMQIAPRFGTDVCWFDLSNVRALQRKYVPVTQVATAPAMVQARLMTINEARADYGLEPLDDGDRLMTLEEVAAMQRGPGALAILQNQAPALNPTDTVPMPALPAAPTAPQPDEQGMVRRRLTENRALDPTAIEARRAGAWKASDAAATTMESRWGSAFRRLFAKQEAAVMARLKGKRGRQMLRDQRDKGADPTPEAAPLIDPAHVFDPVFWEGETRDLAGDLYEGVVGQGLAHVGSRYGVAFDVKQPNVARYISERARKLAGQVTGSTFEAIRSEMAAAVDAGESIDDIAGRIKGVFAAADTARATTIARTEVISAYNGAQTMGAGMLPPDVVGGQEWIATRDARTRDAHAEADGQAVAIGATFDVDGEQLAYPGDPNGDPGNTVNCRCTIGFLTPEEMADQASRAAPTVETRTARLAVSLVSATDNFDVLGFRRALQGAAA